MKQWNKAQERLAKIQKLKIRVKMPKEEVYYSGALVCGICGQVLTTQQTGRTKKDGTILIHYGYRCLNREKGLCTALGMSHKKVEDVFLKYIDNIDELTEIENVSPIEDENEELADSSSLEKRIKEVEIKKREVMDLFMNNNIDHNQLKYMTDELNKNHSLLDNELKESIKKYQPQKEVDKNAIAKTIKEHWEYLSKRERLEFLLEFVESITIVNRETDKVNGRPEILDVKFYE